MSRLKIFPLFLLPGVHVREDIPHQVAIAQKTLGTAIEIELCPYLGSYPGLTPLLAQQFDQVPTIHNPQSKTGRILLSHGSRRRGANQPIAALASQLNALPAYWSVPPSLTEQVDFLKDQGQSSIVILPYFLFRGGLTEAIAQQVSQMQQSSANLQLYLGEPLGVTPALVNLIVEAIEP
jgi:sirohydrochlorin ferrochelatase